LRGARGHVDFSITYDDGTSEITTEIAASCVPSIGSEGCGFEQPLEAMLKALWPASDTSVEFLEGQGHGEGDNAGFLREDSLLIVIVVSDEDDCSASDPALFDLSTPEHGVNVLCSKRADQLYEVQRYVDGLKSLRDGDDPIVFVALSGVPPELAAAQAEIDLSDADAVSAYYDRVLDAPEMQIAIDSRGTGDFVDDNLFPSCDRGEEGRAYPPRRLVEMTKAFGSAGVLGSVCSDDFASTIGGVIRATAERL